MASKLRHAACLHEAVRVISLSFASLAWNPTNPIDLQQNSPQKYDSVHTGIVTIISTIVLLCVYIYTLVGTDGLFGGGGGIFRKRVSALN